METLNRIEIKPSFMLVAYSRKVESAYYSSDNETFYFETHEFFEGKPTAGRPLEKEALKNLLAITFEQNQQETKSKISFKGLVPTNLLHFKVKRNDSLILTWFVPAGFRKMFFSEDLEIDPGSAFQPNLIFHLNGEHLSVFAVMDNKVSVKTELYLAPYFNIDKEGNVCLGTVSVKQRQVKTIDDIMESYEKAFFNSYFSHAGNLYTSVKFNMVSFWRNHIEKKTASFPVEALTNTLFKVSDLIDNSY